MVMAFGSITSGVIVHCNEYTYLWLCLGRLELDTLFTIFL
jgi:hypothetical protein